MIGFCFIGSSSVFAANTIDITVTTNDRTAAVIGYSVNGKKSGGTGKSYRGKGPGSSTYLFGYRRSYLGGKDIPCGSHALTENSHVILINKGNRCRSIVKR